MFIIAPMYSSDYSEKKKLNFKTLNRPKVSQTYGRKKARKRINFDTFIYSYCC